MTGFLKMHGCGNDFVIVDMRGQGAAALAAMDDAAFITRVADRHFGVGCDQFILLTGHAEGAAEMLIRNNDGSDGRMCGNATRCVADMLMTQNKTDAVTVYASGRRLDCCRVGDLVEVDMGAPLLDWQDIPLARATDTLHVALDVAGLPDACCVGMGNPHAVFFLNDVADVRLEDVGSQVEHHPMFPKRTNVEIVHKVDDTTLRMRVWERGTQITLACGSAACATAVAAVRRGLMPRKMAIRMDGGTLHMAWRESDGHILMTGPVTYVFTGTLLSA